MSAEVRRSGDRVWVVDLACGIEEPWLDDVVGAGMRADLHNEARHDPRTEDPSPAAVRGAASAATAPPEETVDAAGRPGGRIQTGVQSEIELRSLNAEGLSPVRKTLLIVLCFFFPFVAVLLAEGLSIRVLWAFLLQLLGHVPGVIYGIYRIVQD